MNTYMATSLQVFSDNQKHVLGFRVYEFWKHYGETTIKFFYKSNCTFEKDLKA